MRTVSKAAGGMIGVLALAAGATASSIEYGYDDGVMNTAVGPPSSFPSDPEMLWGNYFYAEEGGEVITEVSFALGPNFAEDREVGIAIMDDPDDDEDPGNAVLLTQTEVVPEHLGGSEFNHVEVEPTEVEGGFFVAIYAWAEAGIDRPAAQDWTGPDGYSWLLYNPVEQGVDFDDLAGNAFFERLDNVAGAFPGVWMIRATGVPANGEECPADLTGDGTVGGADLGSLLAEWGDCADPDDCPADLTGDGTVGGADLGSLLAEWGGCP